MKCSFCESEWGVSQEVDARGRLFWCCGWCWAHVIYASQPPDVRTILTQATLWLKGKRRKGKAYERDT